MTLIKWSARHRIGVKALDEQHATFAAILNEFHAAMLQGEGKGAADALLPRLASYVRQHLQAEEAMMEAAQYPELMQHRELHREFAHELEAFAARHDKGDDGVYVELLRFLYSAHYTHALEADREYGSWLGQHGSCEKVFSRT